MQELLIELYSEELPSNAQRMAEESFVNLFTDFFNKNNITYQHIEVSSSPCRITIYANKLVFQAVDKEIKGPKVGSDEKILNGFCNKYQVNLDELLIETQGSHQYYFFRRANVNTLESMLLSNLPKVISSHIWPKSMKWGVYNISWIRPLKNILCILDQQILPIQLGHLTANNITFGHKFYQNAAITLTSFAQYKQALQQAKVVLTRSERLEIIQQQIEQICQTHNIICNQDHDLLQEILGLVEFPTVLMGNIPEKFMQLPQELLNSCLAKHQKYFTCVDASGNLANKFLFVCNNVASNFSQIIAGNEKVLTARLSDGLYFYQQDLKTPLTQRFDALESIIFHNKVGTLKDKAVRLEQLCQFLKPHDQELLQAAKWCKCDLTSQVVGEFPDLQGIISKYYAAECSMPEVGQIIAAHYHPQSANDQLPENQQAAILSMLDKLDSLVALMLAGERATGSKDPYALRRNAIGILRILLEKDFNKELKIDLTKLLEYNAQLLKPFAAKNHVNIQQLLLEIKSFVLARLANFLSKTYDAKIVNILINDDLSSIDQIQANVIALASFCQQESWHKLLSCYKRLNNILDATTQRGVLDQNLFISHYEQNLLRSVTSLEQQIASTTDVKQRLMLLLPITHELDEFFQHLLVNDAKPEVANNRAHLLSIVKNVFDTTFNFITFA